MNYVSQLSLTLLVLSFSCGRIDKRKEIREYGSSIKRLNLVGDNEVYSLTPTLTWTPNNEAQTYDFSITDSDCQSDIQTYKKLVKNTITLTQNLRDGTRYCILITGKDFNDNVIASNIPEIITVKLNPMVRVIPIVEGVQFERSHYQTRSVKRLLIRNAFLDPFTTQIETSFSLNDSFVCEIERGYSSRLIRSSDGISAIEFQEDPIFFGKMLVYGLNELNIGLDATKNTLAGETKNRVTLRDFNIMDISSTAFHEPIQSSGGFQGWVSPFSGTVVSKDQSSYHTTGMQNIVNH